MLTIKHLTGLPINYLITVNFHGFKEVVNQARRRLDGRRPPLLQQERRHILDRLRQHRPAAGLPASERRAGSRLRPLPAHRLGPLPRRAPAGVRPLVPRAGRAELLVRKVPALVNAIATNVEVGASGGHKVQLSEIEKYANFGYTLPAGHVFQDQIQDVQCQQPVLRRPVRHRRGRPAVHEPRRRVLEAGERGGTRQEDQADDAAAVLGDLDRPERQRCRRARQATRPICSPRRGYKVLLPPNNLQPNAPPKIHPFHTKIYYDAAQARRRPPPWRSAKSIVPADVLPLPGTRRSEAARARSRIEARRRARPDVPRHDHAASAADLRPSTSRRSCAATRRSAPSCCTPLTQGRRSSWRRRRCSSGARTRTRLRRHAGAPLRHRPASRKAVRMVYKMGGNQYWGIEETSWQDAPALADRSFRHDLGGREFELYYSGSHLADGRAEGERRDLLGRQHAARLALERDHARDRQGSKTANTQASRVSAHGTGGHLRRRLGRPRHGRLLRGARPRRGDPRRRRREDRVAARAAGAVPRAGRARADGTERRAG